MQPMKLQPLYDQLVGAGVVDPSAQGVLPMAIADAYQDLSQELTPSDEQKRLLHECCLVLIAHNFRQLRPDAQGKLIALYGDNPGFEWRASQTEDPE
ncbi:MAG: hypothetical protein AAFY12_11920 [Pseudomonadota bacterium]